MLKRLESNLKIFFLIIAMLALLPQMGRCAEPDFVYGNETIMESVTWHGVVLIKDVLTVFEDVTLTIEPGTVIMFEKRDTTNNGLGENEIYIKGEVVALGTKEKPILFTSAEKVKRPGDWIAVNMMVSEGRRNIFKNCIVEYSLRGFHSHFSEMNLVDCELRYNFLAVQFQDSTISIKGTNIHHNSQGIQFRDSKVAIEDTKITDGNIGIRCVYSEVNFINSMIFRMTMPAFQTRGSTLNIDKSLLVDCRAGVTAQDSTINITNSMVLNNMEDGLSLHNSEATIKNSFIMLNGDDGILIENTKALINGNNIYNNAKYNLTVEQADDVDAKYNYWGADSFEKIGPFNYDKKDSAELGRIIVDGYSTSELKLDGVPTQNIP